MIVPTAEAIWKKLESVWNEPGAPDEDVTGWTSRIAKGLAEMIPGGQEKSIFAYGHDWEHEEHGEYLLDQVWSLERGEKWKDYEGLVLAMECELSYDSDEERWKDFVKLADVRADMRVFIGAVPGGEDLSAMDRFINGVRRFLQGHRYVTGEEQYLIALYAKNGNPDKNLHGWLVYGDGRAPEVLPK